MARYLAKEKKVNNGDALLKHYQDAKAWLRLNGYNGEVDWQTSVSKTSIHESQFLREYAWVVMNCGFRESVVDKLFDYFSLCFCDWESAALISENASACVIAAKVVFNNTRKLNAIVYTCDRITKIGFGNLKDELINAPLIHLRKFPFIGDITARHLAKNLGWDYCKPDRHLVRLAHTFVYESVDHMCSDIVRKVGDPIGVVDLILWRFEVERGKAFIPVRPTQP